MIPRLSQNDDEIYEKFRKDFPDMNVAALEEMKDLKGNGIQWRKSSSPLGRDKRDGESRQ